jgi:hypothetical protein
VDYLEMDVTTPAPLTVGDTADGCPQVARGPCKGDDRRGVAGGRRMRPWSRRILRNPR